ASASAIADLRNSAPRGTFFQVCPCYSRSFSQGSPCSRAALMRRLVGAGAPGKLRGSADLGRPDGNPDTTVGFPTARRRSGAGEIGGIPDAHAENSRAVSTGNALAD